MIIVGAGLSGLLAGALDRSATIIERQPTLPNNHHAVLRFRSDKISKALDIPFRKVRVTKGVAGDDYVVRQFANPADINGYSRKIMGVLAERSIGDLAPVDRYIAPPDLVARLAAMCKDRIQYSTPFIICENRRNGDWDSPVISTAPLPIILDEARIEHDKEEFTYAPIRVMKYRVERADVFQTIYFSGRSTPLYRATITGDELIFELSGAAAFTQYNLEAALGCFDLGLHEIEEIGTERQKYGKIAPLPKRRRQALLYRLTRDHGIYSLGRFACWRNTLLDDVFDDYYRIKSMIGLEAYEHTLRTIE